MYLNIYFKLYVVSVFFDTFLIPSFIIWYFCSFSALIPYLIFVLSSAFLQRPPLFFSDFGLYSPIPLLFYHLRLHPLPHNCHRRPIPFTIHNFLSNFAFIPFTIYTILPLLTLRVLIFSLPPSFLSSSPFSLHIPSFPSLFPSLLVCPLLDPSFIFLLSFSPLFLRLYLILLSSRTLYSSLALLILTLSLIFVSSSSPSLSPLFFMLLPFFHFLALHQSSIPSPSFPLLFFIFPLTFSFPRSATP